MNEQPIYILPQSKPRAVIPKIISTLILSPIFYFGVLLNLSLLELRAEQETTIKLIALVILIIIFLSGIYFSLRHANFKHIFYKTTINFRNKQIKYIEITNINPTISLIDKIFHTYSINLGHHFIIKHIPKNVQIQNYIQKLIQYSRQYR